MSIKRFGCFVVSLIILSSCGQQEVGQPLDIDPEPAPLPYTLSQQIADIYEVDPGGEICLMHETNGEVCQPTKDVIEGGAVSGEFTSITSNPAQVLLSMMLDIHTNYTGGVDMGSGFFEDVQFDFNHLQVRKDIESAVSKEHYNPYLAAAWSYLLGLEGSYEEADQQVDRICTDYPRFCEIYTASTITFTGTVFDENNNPLSDVLITELHTGVTGVSKEDGTFLFEVRTHTPRTLRFSAEKDQFSGGLSEQDILFQSDQMVTADFVLHAYDTRVVFDPKKEKVIQGEAHFIDEHVIVETAASRYTLPKEGYIKSDGEKYDGTMSIYLYEFEPGDDINFLNSSIFTEAQGYIGHQMITFGMPFVVFRDDSGSRIYLPESASGEIIYLPETKVSFVQREELTEEQIQHLLEISSKPGYPITNDFTKGSTMFQGLPSFWNLDQRTGIWYDTGMKLMDDRGTIQAPIYTTKDSTYNPPSGD